MFVWKFDNKELDNENVKYKLFLINVRLNFTIFGEHTKLVKATLKTSIYG